MSIVKLMIDEDTRDEMDANAMTAAWVPALPDDLLNEARIAGNWAWAMRVGQPYEDRERAQGAAMRAVLRSALAAQPSRPERRAMHNPTREPVDCDRSSCNCGANRPVAAPDAGSPTRAPGKHAGSAPGSVTGATTTRRRY